MRPIVPGDLDHCVRTLLAEPSSTRPASMMLILRRADLADRFRKRTGRLLPGMGDGSLMTAAWTIGRVPPPPRCDDAYCETLALVIGALQDWRTRFADPVPGRAVAIPAQDRNAAHRAS